MKKQMTLSTDRKSASEGEYIEIRWACDACPDSLYLAIDSKRMQYNIAVSDYEPHESLFPSQTAR